MLRQGRRTLGFTLGRGPLAAAAGICNVSGFLVEWPLVTVIADTLWYQASGKPQCRRSTGAAAIWMYYWHPGPNGGGIGRGGHFAGWFGSDPRQ